MKLIASFLFFTLSISMCVSQTPIIDSLINLLKTDKQDTTKLIHLYTICDEYQTIGNNYEGLYYGNQTLAFADELDTHLKSEKQKKTIQKYKALTYNDIAG